MGTLQDIKNIYDMLEDIKKTAGRLNEVYKVHENARAHGDDTPVCSRID